MVTIKRYDDYFTYDKVILLTICSLSIIFLEEKNGVEDEQKLTTKSKSMLEELRMMGIGNGIVKMVVKSLKSIKSLFNLISKHKGVVISGITDMFAYTSLSMPILNGLGYLIGKYDLTPETLASNLIGLAVGLGTIITKNGVKYLLDKLKGKISSKNKREILDDLGDPIIKNFSVYKDDEHGEPINDNNN